MELTGLIAIFFITVQCLISAVTLADDNRSLALTRADYFLSDHSLCVFRVTGGFLILKSQTAWTVSSTVSIASYLQAHSLHFPNLGKKKKISHQQLSLIMSEDGIWRYMHVLYGAPVAYWAALGLTHNLILRPYVVESHEKHPLPGASVI